MKKILLVSVSAAALALPVWADCGKSCCKRNEMHGAEVAAAPEAAAKLKDPVCGMEVDAAKAEKAAHGGKTYYFCSKSCKAKFQKNPAQYTEAR